MRISADFIRRIAYMAEGVAGPMSRPSQPPKPRASVFYCNLLYVQLSYGRGGPDGPPRLTACLSLRLDCVGPRLLVVEDCLSEVTGSDIGYCVGHVSLRLGDPARVAAAEHGDRELLQN